MRLHYFSGQGATTNFGDELNRWLWPRIAPEVLARDSETLFVGIGTLLNERLPEKSPKVIFGAGVGYGTAVPRVDDSWRIYFVRGPLSAAALGIPHEASITDPAILLGLAFERDVLATQGEVAFVPHWENAHEGWRRLCEASEIRYVDPRWAPERVLAELAPCRLILAEAMHAAIAADALRIPWLPIETGTHVLRFKWDDWCGAMALPYRPVRWLSNWQHADDSPAKSWKRWLKQTVLLRQIKNATRSEGMLSDDTIFRERFDRCKAMLDKLRRDAQALG